MQEITITIVFLCLDLILLLSLFFLGVYVKRKIAELRGLYDIIDDARNNIHSSLTEYSDLINLAKGVVKHMDDTTVIFQKLIDKSNNNLSDVLIDEIKPKKTRVKRKTDDGARN